MPNDSSHGSPKVSSNTSSNLELSVIVLGAAIFGGVHCLAWNSTFPTQVEGIIWRTCAIAVTTLPLALTMILIVVATIAEGDNMKGVIVVLAFSCLVLYALARLFLIVEMFRSLFYLPPEVFRETWTADVSHFG